MSKQKPKYSIEIDTHGEECPNYEPRFASYDLIIASGNSLDELLDDATIGIMDQDGGELDCVRADQDWMQRLIAEEFLKLTNVRGV